MIRASGALLRPYCDAYLNSATSDSATRAADAPRVPLSPEIGRAHV